MEAIDLSELAVVEESALQTGAVTTGGGICGIVCGGTVCGIICGYM